MTSRVLRMAALAMALGGCSSPVGPVAPLVLSPDAVRLAAQATFGPTVAVVQDIQQRGTAGWIDTQLQLAPSDLGTYPVVADNVNLVCPTGSAATCYRDNFTPFLTEAAFFRNTISGPDQLRQRVAFALSQIVVISGTEVRANYGLAEYEKLLLRDAFGTYRQLLELLPGGRRAPYPSGVMSRELTAVTALASDGAGGLWILDTGGDGRPARLIGWNTTDERRVRALRIPAAAVASNSWLCGLAVDHARQVAYVADRSRADWTGDSHPALLVISLESGVTRRLLEDHPALEPDAVPVTVDRRPVAHRELDGTG